MELNGIDYEAVHFREKYIKDILRANGDLRKIEEIMFANYTLTPPKNIDKPNRGEVNAYSDSFRRQDFAKNYPKRFNVNIFGSARSKITDPDYKHVQDVVRAIAEEFKSGFISGGGPGIMDATNKAAVAARKERKLKGKPANIKSIGINLKLPKEKLPKEDGSIDKRNIHLTFFTRIADMLDFGNGAYTATGGIGSFFPEAGIVLQLKQVGHLEHQFPLIIHPMYKPILDATFEAMYKTRNEQGLTEFISPDDISKNIKFTDKPHEIVSTFKEAYDWWHKNFRDPYKQILETRKKAGLIID